MSEPEHNPFAAPQSQSAVIWTGNVNFEALRTTGNGLRLIYLSLLLLVLLVLVVFGFSYFANLAPGPGPSGLAVLLVTGIGMLLISLMSLIGGAMCLTVPRESGGKGFVIASVAIHGLNLLLLFGGGFFGFATTESLIMSLVNAVSVVLFLLFLRSLASFIDRSDLRRRASRMLTFTCVYGVALIIIAMIPGPGPAAFSFTLVAGLVIVIGALIMFVMFANLVSDLSKAIRNPENSPGDSQGYV